MLEKSFNFGSTPELKIYRLSFAVVSLEVIKRLAVLCGGVLAFVLILMGFAKLGLLPEENSMGGELFAFPQFFYKCIATIPLYTSVIYFFRGYQYLYDKKSESRRKNVHIVEDWAKTEIENFTAWYTSLGYYGFEDLVASRSSSDSLEKQRRANSSGYLAKAYLSFIYPNDKSDKKGVAEFSRRVYKKNGDVFEDSNTRLPVRFTVKSNKRWVAAILEDKVYKVNS